MRLGVIALGLLVASGCRAAAPDVQAPGRAMAPNSLGSIAGRALDPDQLLVELYGLLGSDFLRVVDRLVASRLAEADAGRLGVRLGDGVLELALLQARTDIRTEFGRPGESYNELVRRELGLRPEVHAVRLEIATLRRLVTERVIRATTLARRSAEIRVIVSPDRAGSDALRTRLDAGEDFGSLATETSVDDSAAEGGRVAFLVDDERSSLARAAFQLTPGEVTGPLELDGRFVLLRVEALREPVEGRWADVGARVEASLAADGIAEAEFLHWHYAMEQVYEVELAPLAELLGLARERSTPDVPAEED